MVDVPGVGLGQYEDRAYTEFVIVYDRQFTIDPTISCEVEEL